ncbi:MAG TPA: NADH-quinone oxidoreductase subunit A [Thermoguttaceae bacterium]
MQSAVLPLFLFTVCVIGLAVILLVVANLFNPIRPGSVKRMPYESGMDPIHDTRRRFDVRFHLLAIAFLVFDVELLFLYPWAVATRPAVVESLQTRLDANSSTPLPSIPPGIDTAVGAGLVQNRDLVIAGALLFVALLTFGYVYDWRKGVFQWR